jgi:hypothetical protein
MSLSLAESFARLREEALFVASRPEGVRLRGPRRVQLTEVLTEEVYDFGMQVPQPFMMVVEEVDVEEEEWEEDFGSEEEDSEMEAPLSIPPLDVPQQIPEDFSCTICRDGEREDVVAHPCDRHFFHFECLVGWLSRHVECPLCRRVRI